MCTQGPFKNKNDDAKLWQADAVGAGRLWRPLMVLPNGPKTDPVSE